MRVYLFLLFSLVSINTYAFDYTYDVSGSDDEADPVDGKVYVTKDDPNVSGEIMTDDGRIYYFQGQLRSDGKIYGRTQSGDQLELKIRPPTP